MKRAPDYLNQLAAVLMRSGWATRPRYNGPTPVLHVYAASVPSLGESVSVVPCANPHEHWFCSSTGAFLAPCSNPVRAAHAVAAILSRCIDATLPRRTPQRSAHTDTVTWWGEQTREWWALVPYGTSSRLLAARTPEELARLIAQTRP